MILPKKIAVDCPYCGVSNKIDMSHLESAWPAPIVVLCDILDGGCDTYFVATMDIDITVATGKIINPDQWGAE